jgi:hypothetical protein
MNKKIDYEGEGSMLVCYVGIHFPGYSVSQNHEKFEWWGKKNKEKNL